MSGRGAYYKAKYGGGGRGRGGNNNGGVSHRMDTHQSTTESTVASSTSSPTTRTLPLSELEHTLQRIDGAPYGAYKQLQDAIYRSDGPIPFSLQIVHAQSDAYAAPSRAWIQLPLSSCANIPAELLSNKIRRVALADFMARRFVTLCAAKGADVKEGGGGWSGAKGGDIQMDKPSQHVLERTNVQIIITSSSSSSSSGSSSVDGYIEARFTVGLPARGRSIEGRWAATILTKTIPSLALDSLRWCALDTHAATLHVQCVEDQHVLRSMLADVRLMAFVANGAMLPRRTGHLDIPLTAQEGARPFQSPPSMTVEFTLPHRGTIVGMGIPQGVVLIVGGGFHGKSTLLRALEVGIYDHIPGDGREFVVTDNSAVKIRSEDGRSVTHLNISPFINNLPFQKQTHEFTTTNASGSTSQAANIIEAMQMGCRLLLLDEDTCATNFMARDEVMARLVGVEQEPITTFLERVEELYTVEGVSCICVVGGCGAYFKVAHKVILMDCYQASDVTERAKACLLSSPLSSSLPPPPPSDTSSSSVPSPCPDANGGLKLSHFEMVLRSSQGRGIALESLAVPSTEGEGHSKVRVNDWDKISYGSDQHTIDVGGLEQIVEVGQTRAMAEAMQYLSAQRQGLVTSRPPSSSSSSSSSTTQSHSTTATVVELHELVQQLQSRWERLGLDGMQLRGGHACLGNLSIPRTFELAGAINRWRRLKASTVTKSTT